MGLPPIGLLANIHTLLRASASKVSAIARVRSPAEPELPRGADGKRCYFFFAVFFAGFFAAAFFAFAMTITPFLFLLDDMLIFMVAFLSWAAKCQLKKQRRRLFYRRFVRRA